MQIKLNEQTLEITAAQVTSLHQILDQVTAQLPDTAIITGIVLNDRELEDDWVRQQDSLYVMEEDKLQIITRHAGDLGQEAFQQSHGQFAAIRENFESIAEMLRVEDEAKANAFLAQTVDNLQTYFRIIQESLILMGRSFNDLTIDGKPAPRFMEEFSTKLSEMIDIQHGKDWVLLADVIEYELVPLLCKVDDIYKNA